MQSAEVQEYRIDAVLHMASTGSENEAIQAEATRRLAAWINLRRRLGVEISRSSIDAHPHSLADRGAPRRAQRAGWQGRDRDQQIEGKVSPSMANIVPTGVLGADSTPAAEAVKPFPHLPDLPLPNDEVVMLWA